MSRRNTRQGKARRRAERDRGQVTERERKRPRTSGQGPRAVEDQAVQVAPRPGGPGPRNSAERGSGLRSDVDGGLSAVDLDEADLDTDADLEDADLDDLGDLDTDDADLQATLTVLAVLADDISDVAEVAVERRRRGGEYRMVRTRPTGPSPGGRPGGRMLRPMVPVRRTPGSLRSHRMVAARMRRSLSSGTTTRIFRLRRWRWRARLRIR